MLSGFKRILYVAGVLGLPLAVAQENPVLSVDDMMQGEKWIGVSPSAIQWDPGSQRVYFKWSSPGSDTISLYQAGVRAQQPVKTEVRTATIAPDKRFFSKDRLSVLYEKEGDIVLQHVTSGEETFLTHTLDREYEPQFSLDEQQVIFRKGDNLFSLAINGGAVNQLSNFLTVEEKRSVNEQDQALQKKQLETFAIIRSQEEEKKARLRDQMRKAKHYPKAFFLQASEKIREVVSSPDMRFITFNVEMDPAPARTIIVPDYVSSSGYTETIPGRTKVGGTLPIYKSYIYDRQRDSIYPVSTASLSGIKDIPAYLKEYPERYKKIQDQHADREVQLMGYYWDPNAKQAIVDILAQDHKDRWLAVLNPLDGKLRVLDRQHDEAWVAGPGIAGRAVNIGWINNETFYFQSEASGYSHIYTMNVSNGEKKQITSGQYEVLTLQLALAKRYFYFTANIDHPGKTEFYRVDVKGGNPEKMTNMDGENEVFLSPDEKWLAIRHSYIDKPWELYLQKNEAGAEAVQLTRSTTAQFNAYSWKIPEILSFKNREGVAVYAQVFRPKVPDPSGAAVVFVHSNGYLQNVHYGWSYHYREYLFNNLLVDLGYTVINIDYTGSAGYGRDFRTGIYRHMGGRDLTDLVDGARLLVEKYQVNPSRIGLYGGSYGGFLTLMALLTEADTFASGAALRSVTDWSNYNQRYTSNILNSPLADPKAYRQSSPLFFADGLKGNLLMTHGIVDVNVNFQDIVLLTQKLIELGKENWELAVYPKEDHDFVYPSSWADQYKRILKLFNQTLKQR